MNVPSAASGPTAAAPGDLRNRAVQLQTEIWVRNVIIHFSSVLLIGVFLLNARGAWKFGESVSLVMTLGWIGATWQLYVVRGRSIMVPVSLSSGEVRAFHRRELIRQRDLGWAVLLILYGLTVAMPGFRGGVMLLGAIAMQNGVIAWARRTERSRHQRELDLLDREVEQA